MHDKKIIHRDIKPDNVLLQERGKIDDIKIIDFGTALKYETLTENGETLKRYDKVGTLMFMAPEVMNANEDKKIYYNEKCDMWSIGVIAYILLTGKMPFKLYHEK